MITPITENTSFILSQSDFSMKVKGQRNRGRQKDRQGNNTEKIWAHRFFRKQKADVPKACKMAAEGLRSSVSSPVEVRGAKPPKSFIFFHLKQDKTAIVKVKIQ